MIERAPAIADAMKVSKPTAAALRRLFDALGIAIDEPGIYNFDGFDPIDFGDIAASESKDGASESTGLSLDSYSMNDPARLRITSPWPDAFIRALGDPSTINTIYVASRRIEGAVAVDHWTSPSLRSGGPVRPRRPKRIWEAKDSVSGSLPKFVTQEVYQSPLSSFLSTSAVAKMGTWVGFETPPPRSIIVRQEPTSTERSEARFSDQPMSRETYRVGDIQALLQVERRTAYRRLQNMVRQGTAEKVRRGEYRVRADLLGPS